MDFALRASSFRSDEITEPRSSLLYSMVQGIFSIAQFLNNTTVLLLRIILVITYAYKKYLLVPTL